MPHFVVDKVQNALNDAGKPVKGSRIHVMGVAYKRDIDDLRESPALDVMMLLQRRGAMVTYSDPHVPVASHRRPRSGTASPEAAAAEADCVVIVTDHSSFDYAALVNALAADRGHAQRAEEVRLRQNRAAVAAHKF